MDELYFILKAELEASKDFLALLKDEESALAEGNTERLSEIVHSKSEQLQKIASLTQQRNQRVPLEKMSDWATSHPDSSATLQALIAMAREIMQINEINGRMIDARLRSTQQSLNMLQSLASATTNLYGPDGQSNLAPTGRHNLESA